MLNDLMVKVALFAQVARARCDQEEGQGLVEYALIIALVSVALVIALGLMTTALNGVFTGIQAALDAAN